MGIGISYTGHDGKARQFDDPAQARAFLDSMGAASKRHTGAALREAMRRVPGTAPQMQGRAKVASGGSVVEGPDGLCLRGEEASPLIEGVKMFASVNGSKGFKRMDEIDPAGAAALCGPAFGCDDEDENAEEALEGVPVRIPFVSRNKWAIDSVTGMITEYEFVRELVFSPCGRRVFCTKERRRVVGSFMPGAGGEGNGKYGVRPFWIENTETDENPMLDFLAFGKEADLDTWDGEKFTCNYDSGGSLLEDPPVKIVMADTCAYNPLTAGGEG